MEIPSQRIRSLHHLYKYYLTVRRRIIVVGTFHDAHQGENNDHDPFVRVMTSGRATWTTREDVEALRDNAILTTRSSAKDVVKAQIRNCLMTWETRRAKSRTLIFRTDVNDDTTEAHHVTLEFPEREFDKDKIAKLNGNGNSKGNRNGHGCRWRSSSSGTFSRIILSIIS